MATIWINEFRNTAFNNPGIPALPAVGNQTATVSTTASTLSVGAGTNIIGVQADAVCWLLSDSSASTSVVTSTMAGAVRIPITSAPLYYGLAPYSRITAVST